MRIRKVLLSPLVKVYKITKGININDGLESPTKIGDTINDAFKYVTKR